jgi:hypothetical protein
MYQTWHYFSGAGQETKRIANELNLALNISVVYETTPKEEKQEKEVICTYLGAEGIVDALSSGADVVVGTHKRKNVYFDLSHFYMEHSIHCFKILKCPN